MVPQTRTLKGSALTKGPNPLKSIRYQNAARKDGIKREKKGSFLMKSRCRTDLLASIFPSCILVYFLPILLRSADLFAGLFKKNTFQRT